VAPVLFSRSRFPARGSELGAAAGRQDLGAPPSPAADPQTRRGHCSAARRCVALSAVAPALRPQPVSRSGFRARRCSGATRPWRAAAARNGPLDLGGPPLGGEAKCGASGRRPCSAPAAGSPLGVPSSALQRGVKSSARRRPPQPTPRLRGSTARRRGEVRRFRPAPLLCTRSQFPTKGSELGAAAGRQGLGAPVAPVLFSRSRFPARGSELGAAAGRQDLGAPPSPAADPQTRRGHCSAARRCVALSAVAPALRPQPVSRSGFRARRCSGATRPWRAAAARNGPLDLGGPPLGGEAKCGASGRRPCSAPAAGSPLGVPSSALQRGDKALARHRRPQRTARLRGATPRRRACLLF